MNIIWCPILGVAHVAYIPNKRVVGISKLARGIDVFGKRLQTQETMTAQVASCIYRMHYYQEVLLL